MVAPAVRQFGDKPVLCLARPMLYCALECLDRGDDIGAGVRLRHAVLLFVVAACEWYGCEIPKRIKYPRAVDYIRALRKAGQLDKCGAEWLLEMVDAGNKAAHLSGVERAAIKGGIAILFAMMDDEPYAGHERKPVVTSHKTDPYDIDDCDDDDGANWWKEGGAT